MGNAAALVFPIDWPEPFGLVLIEAMACGTPVVAYSFGSVPELVDQWKIWFSGRRHSGSSLHDQKKLTKSTELVVVKSLRIVSLPRRMAADYVTLYTQIISEETVPLEREFSGGSETK